MSKNKLKNDESPLDELDYLNRINTPLIISKDANASLWLSLENGILIINGEGSTDISTIIKSLTKEALNGFIQTITSIFQRGDLSSKSIINGARSLSILMDVYPSQEITDDFLSGAIESLKKHKKDSGEYTKAKAILVRWHKLGYKGINNDAMNFLNNVSIKSKNKQGKRVRSDNQEEGWYTDLEYNDLVATIWADFEAGTAPLWNTTALLLSAQYGRRPIQMAHLKIGDLKNKGSSFGISGRRIEFPGAKDTTNNLFRSSKIEAHPLSDELWHLCNLQASETITRFEKELNYKLTTDEKMMLPLFTYRQNPSFSKK